MASNRATAYPRLSCIFSKSDRDIQRIKNNRDHLLQFLPEGLLLADEFAWMARLSVSVAERTLDKRVFTGRSGSGVRIRRS